MGYLNPEMFSKHGHLGQDWISENFWQAPNESVDVLDRTKCPQIISPLLK